MFVSYVNDVNNGYALTTLGHPDDLGAQHMTTLGPGVLKSSVPTLEF